LLFVLGYSTKLQNCFHPAREDVLHTMQTNHIWCCHIAILHLFCPQNMLVRSWFYVFSYRYLHSTASPTLFFGSCWRRSHVVFLSALCCVLVRSLSLRIICHPAAWPNSSRILQIFDLWPKRW
jgi:hypothetical protein